MTTTILTALTLGLFAGLTPGPCTTVVARTALAQGIRACLLLSLTPPLADLPPMFLSALLLVGKGMSPAEEEH